MPREQEITLGEMLETGSTRFWFIAGAHSVAVAHSVGWPDVNSSDFVNKIMRTLPEVREPFWKTFEAAKTNPGALRYIVMLMAPYLHLGPFSKHVISEIDRRIAELDDMPPMRATWLVP